VIICDACGYENPSNVAFCEACGTELTLAPTPPTSSTEDPFAAPVEPVSAPTLPTPQPTVEIFPSPSAPVTYGMAKLVAKAPNAPLPEFILDSNNIVGRFDPDTGPVEIDLEGFPGEDTISRNHAEIYQEDGQWKIKDLGSTNGVFIKRAGQTRFSARITLPEILMPGDEIAIAKIRFLFQAS
jgi:pSer/pThr/pTyr-binding forkhead associated (FHA) protein